MSRWVLDVPKLADAVESVRRHRGITGRTVAAEIGVSPSTMTRLTQGHRPDADALVSLLAWLNAEIRTYTREDTPDE